MNRQQLLDFDEACRRSMADGDAWMDRFLDGGGCATKGALPGGVGKPVYLPLRSSDSLDNELQDLNGQRRTLRRMLLAAGAGAEVERLREEGLPGGSGDVCAVDEPWARFDAIDADESAQVSSDPDCQALACLRLLQANSNTRDHAWVILAASRRLVRLLSEYPVLMHPRLVWDARKFNSTGAPKMQRGTSFPNDFEPAPMGHIIINSSQARMPSLELGVSPEAYKNFAAHPAVAAGIRCEAPHLVTMELTLGLVTRGRTIGDMLFNSSVIHSSCLGNILRMDRMRRAEGLPTMLDGNRHTVFGYARSIALSFHAEWMYGRGNDWQSPLEECCFKHELRLDPRFHESTRATMADYLPKLFSASHSQTEASKSTSRARFERMLRAFVEAGLVQSEREASRLVYQAAMPPPPVKRDVAKLDLGEPPPDGLASATFEEAHHLLQRWADEGHDLDEMHSSVQAHLGGSPWFDAVSILKTHHDMNRHIKSAVPAGNGSDAAPVLRQRQRHRV